MNFSEFKRILGAEPRSEDPEFRRARHSSPEFEQATAEAERFEEKLEQALTLPAPTDLIEDIRNIGLQDPAIETSRGWWPMALAASLLLAVGAAGLVWKMNHSWDSVEDYLVDHYRHDGAQLIALADQEASDEVQAILAEFEMQAKPDLADIVGVIKYCPTPDGKGVHMVLNTEEGPVTVIYMPGTAVSDRDLLAFDSLEAILVQLRSGSAAIIGSGGQNIAHFHALVQNSILPTRS